MFVKRVLCLMLGGLSTIALRAEGTKDAGNPEPTFEIVGVQLVKKSGILGHQVFYRDKGYTLAVSARLPDRPLEVTAVVETATTDTNESLLVKEPRRLRPGKTYQASRNETLQDLLFEMDLSVPPEKAKFIKQLAGHLEYNVCSDPREYNFDLADLKKAGQSRKLGATIVPEAGRWASQIIAIQLNVAEPAIKAITFFDEKGREIKCRHLGRSWGKLLEYNYVTERYLFEPVSPSKGRVHVVIYGTVERKVIPFKFVDLTFMGDKYK